MFNDKFFFLFKEICEHWQQRIISSNNVTFWHLNNTAKVCWTIIGRHDRWQQTQLHYVGGLTVSDICCGDLLTSLSCTFPVRRKVDWTIRRLWMCISSASESCCWCWQVNWLLLFPRLQFASSSFGNVLSSLPVKLMLSSSLLTPLSLCGVLNSWFPTHLVLVQNLLWHSGVSKRRFGILSLSSHFSDRPCCWKSIHAVSVVP